MASASASASRAPGSRRSATARPVARVRWDRLGRIAMLCVMAALLYLYVSAGARLLSSWGESKRDSAQVRVLERQNRVLHEQRSALASPTTVQEEARRLGMIRPGEQAYIVSGLPSN